MIPASGHSQRPDRVMPRPRPRPTAGGLRDALGALFPSVPESARARGARVLGAVVQVAAVGIASWRCCCAFPGAQPGAPSLATTTSGSSPGYPTSLALAPYGGYVQVLPRFIAQVVSYLPLADAALAFALAGVGVAACCALFIFHANAGHIESVKLRALLAVALVLLPSRRWNSSAAG